MSKENETEWPRFVGKYQHCSRGYHYAKHIPSGTWASRDPDTTADVLVLDRPGKWMVGSKDGFRRKETRYVMVTKDGRME